MAGLVPDRKKRFSSSPRVGLLKLMLWCSGCDHIRRVLDSLGEDPFTTNSKIRFKEQLLLRVKISEAIYLAYFSSAISWGGVSVA